MLGSPGMAWVFETFGVWSEVAVIKERKMERKLTGSREMCTSSKAKSRVKHNQSMFALSRWEKSLID